MTAPSGTALEPAVLLRRDRNLGRITLNRPRAINALNHDMVRQISCALGEWAHDETVHAVVLDGAGDRGLCAGGDIRAIYFDAKAGGVETYAFWHDEYRLNAQIARFPKPFVAVMDGLVMGGGVGLSAHASHRLVTDRSAVGMPEVKIGLVPDVGCTYLLSRAPGRTGLHAALTGAILGAGDALAMGLADRFAPHPEIADVIDAVADVGADAAFATLLDTAESQILAQRGWIDECYEATSIQQVHDQLAAHSSPDAQAAAKTIAAAAPLSLAVTFEALRGADAMSTLEEALNRDYRMVHALFQAPDLTEGIRAQVIDKDRNPQWRPARLTDVTAEMTAAYFAPTPTVPFPESDTRPKTGVIVDTLETILVDRDDERRTATITLNRPQALNALNRQLMNELVLAATEFDADPGIGCIIIRGSDRAFAAGADIKEMQPGAYPAVYLDDLFRGWDRLAEVRTPVVAAVAGHALGGGCELAMLCDIVIAADNAKFGQPEIRLGVIPGIGGSQRLTRAIGKAKAMEMCLTGRTITADEAEKAGLVSRVVKLADLNDEVSRTAATIASMSLPVAMMTKEVVNRAFETTLAEGVRFERRLFHATFATSDQKEGMAAFVERRDPDFRHR